MNKTPLEYEIEKYEHEISSFEWLRDIISNRIEKIKEKLETCRHLMKQRERGKDDGEERLPDEDYKD